MPLPVVISTNDYGLPMTESDNDYGLSCEVATNGYGLPVVLVASGGLPVKGVAEVPDAFASGDWSVADAAPAGTITITITSLPDDGGAIILDIEYSIEGGPWTSLGGAVPGAYDVGGLTPDVMVGVHIRAVNAAGAGPQGTNKAVTPT